MLVHQCSSTSIGVPTSILVELHWCIHDAYIYFTIYMILFYRNTLDKKINKKFI